MRPHRHARVERSQRVLKNHLHAFAHGLPGGFVFGLQVLALPRDAARSGGNQIEQTTRQGRFAAARLAHNAQRFAGHDVKRHAINRLEHAHGCPRHQRLAGEVEVHFEIAN